MPSARRRRFSVQNGIANREKNKSQNETQIRQLDPDLEIKYSHNIGINSSMSRNKMYPNTSQRSSMLEIVTECKSTTSTASILDNNIIKSDKEITASSSNIDLFTILNSTNTLSINKLKENFNDDTETYKIKDVEHIKRDRTPRHDKHPHRVKVRSPKRKVPVIEKKDYTKKSIGIDVVNWNEVIERNEIEVQIIRQVSHVGENTEEERVSSHSMEDMCRICHSGEALSTELGRLISACSCRGTVGRVHVKCLERWLTESGKSRCELCGIKYATKRVHKFGILKAIMMWFLSNNSKHVFLVRKVCVRKMVARICQMIVDFFGIMIMTPIAVVAAGLTGKTFAGLMAQDQLTPWPLASTFVLACMTLVCYYCWIVSALTRHALGWWIWYRSHYEVRLQFQETDEELLFLNTNTI